MTTPPPEGTPARRPMTSSQPSTTILPDDTWPEVWQKTLGRDYRRRVRARLLELWDPLRQWSDDLWLCCLGHWSPASHLQHTCHLCGECHTVFSAATMGAERCRQCSLVAACPWPEPPADLRRRTEEEALHRRIKDAQTPSLGHTGPAGAALLSIHVHLRDPTSVPHLSHVFAPCNRPTPRLAEPTAPCLAEGGMDRSTPELAAERRRRLSGAWWQTR